MILGFLLTGIFGTFLSDRLQEKSWEKQFELEKNRQEAEWKREKRFEIIRRKLDEGQNSLEQISDLLNLRFYRLQNTFIFISKGDISSANKNWQEYFETVEEWNVKLIINQNKIRRLVDEESAIRFNNYETDNAQLENPSSIHGKFYVVHEEMLELMRCLRSPSCTIEKEKKQHVQKLL